MQHYEDNPSKMPFDELNDGDQILAQSLTVDEMLTVLNKLKEAAAAKGLRAYISTSTVTRDTYIFSLMTPERAEALAFGQGSVSGRRPSEDALKIKGLKVGQSVEIKRGTRGAQTVRMLAYRIGKDMGRTFSVRERNLGAAYEVTRTL